MKFLVCDNTGLILRSGTCQPIDLPLQASEGELVFQVKDNAFDGSYVDDLIWNVDVANQKLISEIAVENFANHADELISKDQLLGAILANFSEN